MPKGRELLTIKTDCDLKAFIDGLPALDALTVAPDDTEGLIRFGQTYGFKGLVKNLSQGAAPAQPAGSQAETRTGAEAAQPAQDGPASPASHAKGKVYDTVLDWAMLEAWLKKIEAAELVALDTETTSLDEMQAEIVGISFSVVPGEAAYVPLAHIGPDAPKQLSREKVLERLKPWLENPAKAKLGQHVKYDRHVFANHGIEVQGYAHDTMLQSYVLEVHKPHGLASLAERHVGRKGLSFEDLCGKGVHQIRFDQVDVARAAEYSCEDSDMTLDVHLTLWPSLQNDERLRAVYELEIASSETLYRIERNGVLIDAPTLAAQSHELGKRIMELERQAHERRRKAAKIGHCRHQ